MLFQIYAFQLTNIAFDSIPILIVNEIIKIISIIVENGFTIKFT